MSIIIDIFDTYAFLGDDTFDAVASKVHLQHGGMDMFPNHMHFLTTVRRYQPAVWGIQPLWSSIFYEAAGENRVLPTIFTAEFSFLRTLELTTWKYQLINQANQH